MEKTSLTNLYFISLAWRKVTKVAKYCPEIKQMGLNKILLLILVHRAGQISNLHKIPFSYTPAFSVESSKNKNGQINDHVHVSLPDKYQNCLKLHSS